MAQPNNNTNTHTNTTPVNVGVILDVNNDEFGKIWLSCINMALSDFYTNSHDYRTRLLLNVRDSKTDVVAAAAAALDLIKNVQVQAIIGPENSMQNNFVIDLGNKSQVPILSFSATNPSLTSSIKTPYFFRGITNDSSQVGAITALIQAFGWREAVPIYVDNEFGQGMIPYLTDSLQAIDTRVPYRSVISPMASDDQIVEELYKLMTMQTRVFIVHMSPSLGSRIFAKAKHIGMMEEGFVWIVTDGLADFFDTLEQSVIDSMQGVLGVRRYVPRTKKLENFQVRWKRKFQQENPDIVDAKLNIFGLLAYDVTVALAIAVEKSDVGNFRFDKQISNNVSIELEAIGVSENGPNLVKALSSTRFRGLTGGYSFVDGQLQSLAFQIVNVNGYGTREIGFWTPEKKVLMKKLMNSSTSNNNNSASKPNLRPIIWPGDSTSVPKGWEIPTNHKKLHIGVPKKTGFTDFVKVEFDSTTNKSTVTGYCIDVFEAVMKALPYAVTYEYIPFEFPNGMSAGTYDDLVYQVNLGNFDAVVGDITILANRSRNVDFTLPYTESGVSMIVPIKDKKKNAWVFLKPLTWDLWMTSACFFAFIGFVVWVLEHRINEDFRGPIEHQVGTSFWFSFSTMVFSQRERVISNLGRFVVIVWYFVVLILTQSYTASLTSHLTVQQLKPTITDVHELINRGENVGYQKGSFVSGILTKLGFNENKLIEYNSPEECNDLFKKGSAKDGIAAAFDEVPSIRLFIGQYCSKYTMTEPTFKTAGFGFVFPLNSPLGRDVSRAILNVTESEKMKEIEDVYFKKHASCPESSTLVSSNSLGLNSFWGLFLIAGIAAILALIIFTAIFIYEHWNVLKKSDPRTSIWTRIQVLSRIFISRDPSAHAFKDKSGIGVTDHEPSPITHHYPASPSSYSQHTDFALYGGPGTPSMENNDPNPNLNDQATQQIAQVIQIPDPNPEISKIP
ncbi:hypothetical protein EZV62_013699 [Acer yangbiense]|uniref:Glutamate receptor n=1 Tax=Acer yangbiense TaxID=1000413 RepID=A0A5C7I0Q7_9ROSI|nr:hypothetical protein EZV62_013699 [Acer yangbiense]